MKKKMFIVSFLVMISLIVRASASAKILELIADTDDGAVVDVEVQQVEFVDIHGKGYKKISSDGFGIFPQPGAPGVLVKGTLIDIPPDCNVEVEAFVLETVVVEDFDLAPSPKITLTEGEAGNKSTAKSLGIDETIYGMDLFFPQKIVEVAYTGYLRDRRVAKFNIYPIQYNPVIKSLNIHKKIRINIRYSYLKTQGTPRSGLLQSMEGQAVHTPFEKIYSSSLLNYNQHRQYRFSKDNTNRIFPIETHVSELSESPFAVKVVVSQEGIYKIAYEDLDALGIDLASATNENLKITNQGEEIAIYCSGSGKFVAGDYVLFYGESFKSLYSKKNVYWIFQAQQDGKRMTVLDARPQNGYNEQKAFKNTYHAEEDERHGSLLPPHEEGADHWFWYFLDAKDEDAQTKDFPILLQSIDQTSGNYSFSVHLRAKTNPNKHPNHHTRIYVNGSVIDDFTWDSEETQYSMTRVTENISPKVFTDGVNTITIEAVNDLGVSVDQYFINWFEIEYWDTLVAEENYLKFNSSENAGVQFNITNFTNQDVWAFNISDPYSVGLLINTEVAQNGSTFTLSFEDVVSENSIYCATSSDSFNTPDEMVVDEQSFLKTARNEIDYIIITHERFYESAQELKQYRQSKGLTAEVVKIQDIYDEFSHGLKDAAAIKDFLAYAYTNWHATDHPTYVVLIGDASIDYRDDLGYYADGSEDLVPTALYQTSILGDTATDNWFVCVAGEDYLPEMFIGRLSVKTTEDIQSIIEKIKNYEKESPSVWWGNVIFAADDESMFESISDTLATLLPEGFNAVEVYVSQYEDISSATQDLIATINAGAVITNYTGHGHVSEWAQPYLFKTPDFRGSERNDVDKLSNDDKLTFATVLNCMSGYFPGWEVQYSIAEELVRAENKGAIGCLASTSAGYPSEHQVLAKKLFNNFFNEGNKIAGSLVTASKIEAYNQMYSRDVIETFALFGDPAVELKLVSSSDFTDFAPQSPAQNAELPKRPPPTFTWGKGLYERFKVQFSSAADFPPEDTITAPLMPYVYITTDSYEPRAFIWSILRIMGSRNEKLYWRVVAYDDVFNPVSYSNYKSFTFEE